MKDEKHMPTSGKIYPHILITGSFKDVHDMYRWSNGLAQVDCNIPELDSLLAEIIEGCRTDMEKYVTHMPGYNKISVISLLKQVYWDTNPILPQKCCVNGTATAKEWQSCSVHC